MKRVWFVRHGEAEHNLASARGDPGCWDIRDPALTSLGEEQARVASTDPALCDTALAPPGSPNRAEVVVVSPLWRTMQTAINLCSTAASRAPNPTEAAFKLIAHPDLQEINGTPCDTGRPLSEILPEFQAHADFAELAGREDTWFQKPTVLPLEGGKISMDGQQELMMRLHRFMEWLLARPEERFICVAHHGVLAFLLNIDFLNCEVIEMHLSPGDPVRGEFPRWQVAPSPPRPVVPVRNEDGSQRIMYGSLACRTTLAACVHKFGMGVARETARRAGLPDPSVTPPPMPPVRPTH